MFLGLKDFYYAWEAKWNAFIDWLAGKKIPFYKVSDAVDKVIPSAALVLLLVVAAAAFFISGFFFGLFGSSVVSFEIVDESGNPVSETTVNVFLGDEVKQVKTDAFGKTEAIGFPRGTSIGVGVEKEGYVPYSDVFVVETDRIVKQIRLTQVPEIIRTLLLRDSLNQPLRKTARISFSCTNSGIGVPTIAAVDGKATIKEPRGCQGLIASIEAQGFEPIQSLPITQDQQIVYLTESIAVFESKGKLQVEVRFNGELVQENITVLLYKDDGVLGIGPLESNQTENGLAIFETAPDRYFVQTVSTTFFGGKKSGIVGLQRDEIKRVTIDIERNILGKIRAQLVDKDSRVAVKGALVTLKRGLAEESLKESDSNGIAEFLITEDAEYELAIDHQNYCLKTARGIRKSDSVQQIEMQKDNGECGATLKVKVVDQDGKAIKNATVGLYNPDGFSIGFAEKTTNLNGIAEFTRVPSGDYKAFSFKGTASGWSDVAHFVQRQALETELVVTLLFGEGLLRIGVFDQEFKPLQFAELTFIDTLTGEAAGGGSIPITSPDGSIEVKLKTDKTVYAIITKDGFADYTTNIIDVAPNSLTVVNVIMEREIISGEATVEFIGLFAKTGEIARVLNPKETYNALFKIRVPDQSNYAKTGLHVRTGNNRIVEKDRIFVKSISAPGASTIVKSGSYTPPAGEAEDMLKVTNSDAKWAQAEWNRKLSGVIEASAKVGVKETTKPEDILEINYRVYGVRNQEYHRNPVDDQLGLNANTLQKQGLYANTHKQIFQTGIETLCTPKFCFAASILDKQTQLIESVRESYNASILREYKLNFTVLNSSLFQEDSFLDAEIRISSETGGIIFKNYDIIGPQAERKQSTGIVGFDSQWIKIGNLVPNTAVIAGMDFSTSKSGRHPVAIRIRSGQKIVFEKTMTVNVSAAKNLSVSISPTVLASGIAQTILVGVADSDTNSPIEGAIVKARDRFGNMLLERTTNTVGQAALALPAMAPGETVKIIAEKPDYERFETQLIVKDSVLKFDPNRLGTTLNAKTQLDKTLSFSITNETGFPLTISSAAVGGMFNGLLDEQKINDSMAPMLETRLDPGIKREFTVKAVLSDKGKNILETKTVSGFINIEAKADSQAWQGELPLAVTVGLGGELDSPECLTLSKKTWKTFTDGRNIELPFEIENNCTLDGVPAALNNLESRVVWQSNKVADLSLRTETGTIEIRPEAFKPVAEKIEGQDSVPVTLVFDPEAGVVGTGNAVVEFRAKNPTDKGLQEIKAKLALEIAIINLKDCVGFDKDLIIIQKTSSPRGTVQASLPFPIGQQSLPGTLPFQTASASNSFNIQAFSCGATVNIRLDSENITVAPKSLVLQSTDQKTVQVVGEASDSGQYPIFVYARRTGEQEKLIKMIRVRIVDPEQCIELNRYEYDISIKPGDGTDNGELTNNCYDKVVTVLVRYDERDLGKAMLVGLMFGLVGLVGGLLQGALGGGGLGGGGLGAVGLAGAGGACPGGNCGAGAGGVPPGYSPGGFGGGGLGGFPAGQIVLFQQGGYPGGGIPGGFPGGVPGGFGGQFGADPNLAALQYGAGAAGGLGGGGPFGNFLQAFMMGTMWAYSQQEHGEFQTERVEKDLVINKIELVKKEGTDKTGFTETKSEDIKLFDKKAASVEPNPKDPRLNIEIRELEFKNSGGIVQASEASPFFRVLKVNGERRNYPNVCSFDKKREPKFLRIKERKAFKEKYNLQFNSPGPETTDTNFVVSPLANCVLEGLLGVTGKDKIPKIGFSWNWNELPETGCDETSTGSVFCDATQFSITALKRIQKTREFIEKYAPFDCPTTATGVSSKNQNLTGIDVGITSIQAKKQGNDTNVLAVVESNNAGEVTGTVSIEIRDANTGSVFSSCSRHVSLTTRAEASCPLALPNGRYIAKATLVPILCSGCQNTNSGNDAIEMPLNLGAGGVQLCEPYSTARIKGFIEATELAGNARWAQQERDEVIRAASYNAFLMSDAYPNDFRNDFDEFCKTVSFFDCPDTYLQEDGLGELFASAKFKFDYIGNPSPIDPGKYRIDTAIEFNNPNWQFFNASQPSASIRVKMTKLESPSTDSIFYYLPFDATIGLDSNNGRQGYGTNFSPESKPSVKINSGSTQVVSASHNPKSAPISNGWIKADRIDSFRKLNNDSRGILLDTKFASGTTTVNFSPSFATPLLMKITRNNARDAFGFYSIELDSQSQSTGTQTLPWTGVGGGCFDFLKEPIARSYRNRFDSHALNAQCAGISADRESSYGLEWCNAEKKGTAFLETVVFTPQTNAGIIKRTGAADEMVFIGADSEGAQVPLNGVPGMQYNSYGSSTIDSIQRVFELVEQGKACIVGHGTRNQAKFFWNPKVILEELSAKKQGLENTCIKAG